MSISLTRDAMKRAYAYMLEQGCSQTVAASAHNISQAALSQYISRTVPKAERPDRRKKP